MLRAIHVALFGCLLPVVVNAQATIPTRAVTRNLLIDANDEDLSPVASMMVARDGSIAIAQPQDHLIRFFDSHGTSLGTVGRSGGGPGEFRTIARLGWRGDTLWASDQGSPQLTLISPDRKFLRTVPLVRTVTDPGGKGDPVQILGAFALYADGSQLLGAFLPRARPSWARPELDAGSRLVFPRVSTEGAVRGLSGWVPDDPCGLDLSALNSNCARPLAAISPSGDRIAFVTMATVGADSGSYRVTVLGSMGDTLFVRRYPFTARRIPTSLSDSLRAVDASRPSPPLPPGTEARLGTPKVFPPVKQVVIGRDGTLLLSYTTGSATAQHLLLDPTGRPLGMVTLPASVKVMVVARTELWGTMADANGLESIVRYRLQ